MHLKKLKEQRAAKVAEMQELLKKAKEETRAMNPEELEQFDQLEKDIKAIDQSIIAEERAKEFFIDCKKPDNGEQENRAAQDEADFADYIRGTLSEQRANGTETNLTLTDNGAVIPSSIANKIIKTVEDRCPIYSLATRYNVGGTLNIPYYDETTQSISMEYATEFAELESSAGKFKSIELKGFLAGALSKISKSLVNNLSFDLVPFVVEEMTDKIAKWIEKELLIGTADKVEGLSGVTNAVTAASATEITADELIDLQELIPDIYQAGAVWIMNKATRTAIRKLKDGDGNYLLNKDATSKWGYTLFGKDVYTSDNMPKMEAGAAAIYYGDMSGLAVKLAEDVNIDVLREKFATQHAIGIVGWVEIDSKVENTQKIAKLVMKAAANGATG